MTICSWRTQSPKRPQKFVCPHAKLRNSKVRCTTSSVHRDRHLALCQQLNFERSISRDDIAASLKSVRLIHRYIGLFFSPMILFFAITGGLQMFGLHETARGSSYIPPNILVHLSQLHKKGTLYLPPRKVAVPNSAKSDGAKPDGPKLEVPKPTQASPATPPTRFPRRYSLPPQRLHLPYRRVRAS